MKMLLEIKNLDSNSDLEYSLIKEFNKNFHPSDEIDDQQWYWSKVKEMRKKSAEKYEQANSQVTNSPISEPTVVPAPVPAPTEPFPLASDLPVVVPHKMIKITKKKPSRRASKKTLTKVTVSKKSKPKSSKK